ncbi:NAD-dependent protein deacetylase sirtuin-3, mitochondrial isoform X9 [Ursus maritimus]|uniref:NAD-dependent protein deacetylase sirtuin-3, mitochondrial isoform X9 n=1 Tax=Ursus maritimus TaxID=29073 RepID=A0A8M1GLT1_URSMA|nr:NAD-dependent protein deacetylase sirtuin-3, mitochondrial isoform X9 [Ursus maritimus]
MRLPNTVPVPALEPATLTVAAPAPVTLAAVSVSLEMALVRELRLRMSEALFNHDLAASGSPHPCAYSASGIPASKLVEAHGSFASATCTVCQRPSPGKDIWADVTEDRIPRCPVCTGIVKPDVVFFGEALPQRFLLHVLDFPMADLLLILGTSLEVEPFASLSEAVQSSVPRLLINRDLVGPFAWRPRSRDVVQLGDVVHGVERLAELLGWTQELQDLIQQETEKLDGRDK